MKRVLTAAVFIPIVLAITWFAPNWIFAFAVGLVAALAVEEFLSLGARRGIGRPGRWFLALAALVTASFFGGAGWVITSLALSVLALLTVTIFGSPIETALGRVGI